MEFKGFIELNYKSLESWKNSFVQVHFQSKKCTDYKKYYVLQGHS